MEDDSAGDPVKGRKWTHKTNDNLAEALKPGGIYLSANTIARVLKQTGYSLRVKLKNLESARSKPPSPG